MTDQLSAEGAGVPENIGSPVTDSAPAQDTAEQKPVTAAESPPAEEQPKEPKGVGKRIDELTRLRRDAERDRDHWRDLALRMQPQSQGKEATTTSEAEQDKDLAYFGYDETKYRAHVAERMARQAAESARAEFTKLSQEREAAARRAVFDARAEAFAKDVGDYEDVIAGKWACSEPMAEVIEESDEGPALAYYLAQNPDESAKLARMSAAKAGKELAKLEDRLVAERKKAAAKPVSNTPPPAPRIEGSGDPGLKVDPSSPDSDKLSDNEWARLRNKQTRKRSS